MSGTDISSGGSMFGSILGAPNPATAKSIGKSAVEGVSKGVQKGTEKAVRRAVTHVMDKVERGKKRKLIGRKKKSAEPPETEITALGTSWMH